MIFQNAPTPLTLPTHDGSGQAVHPSVIDFLVEHGKQSWGGYRHWMAMTPYPFTNDAEEDPNLIASNDRVNWVVPAGIVNPLDDALGGMALGFHNDPDMVYNPETNEIWLYYRFSSDAKQEIKLIKIKENMEVSAPIVVHLLAPFTQAGNITRSISIWREGIGKWHMWGSGGNRPYTNHYFSSVDGLNWSNAVQVLNQNGVDPFHAIGYENWHTSCKPNLKENRIEFFTYCFVLGGTFDTSAKIFYTEVPMNNLTLMTMPSTAPIMSVGTGWDGGFLYRCSAVIEDLGDKVKYHLYYSARSANNVWGIGYTSFTTESTNIPINPGEYWQKGFMDSVKLNGNLNKVSSKKVKFNGKWVEIKEIFVKR